MVQPPTHLPDLTHLYRTNLADRLLDVTFGGEAYTEPTQFQVTTAARLLDKCLNAWDLAVGELEAHAQVREGVAPPLLSPSPGVTRAFFRAIDHFENLVDSLTRLSRLLQALEASPELSTVTSSIPLPSRSARDRIRNFRNRIAHGDEDIEQRKAGQGFATATLRIDPAGIELQHERLEYTDLAAILEQMHDYLRAVSQQLYPSVGSTWRVASRAEISDRGKAVEPAAEDCTGRSCGNSPLTTPSIRHGARAERPPPEAPESHPRTSSQP